MFQYLLISTSSNSYSLILPFRSSTTAYKDSKSAYSLINQTFAAYTSCLSSSASTFTFTSTLHSASSTSSLVSAPPYELSSVTSTSVLTTVSLLPPDAVATNSFLQQGPALKKLTHQWRLQKPRHAKHTQLPPCEAGSVTGKLSTFQINDLNKIASNPTGIANLISTPPCRLNKYKRPYQTNRNYQSLQTQILLQLLSTSLS